MEYKTEASTPVLEPMLRSLHTAIHVYPLTTLLLTPFVVFLVRSFYRISPFHPLHRIPGPKLAHITSLYLLYHAYKGDECTAVQALHDRYGPVVRTGPLDVDILEEFQDDSPSALHDIYVEKGGFLKAPFYANFDIDGHRSIFSNIDPKARLERVKVVAPLFSTKELRNAKTKIDTCVDGFIDRLRREIEGAKLRVRADGAGIGRFDMLDICRSLAIDVVTGYLLDSKYGACEEDLPETRKRTSKETGKESIPIPVSMSASAMVDAFVAVGRVWYLPSWAFNLFDKFIALVWPDQEADQSIDNVYSHVSAAVEKASATLSSDAYKKTPKFENPSYPAELLAAGFSVSETNAQCKDIIFAGTDSTGMNLGTLMFNLVKNQDLYHRLRIESSEYNNNSPPAVSSTKDKDESHNDPQSLALFHATIKEGLRVAMANPSRLARTVAPSGYTYTSYSTGTPHTYTFPPGTIISCTPHHLHFNPSVFPAPHTFNPDRWLTTTGADLERMNRSHIAFGLGSRACIARNLARMELEMAVRRVIEEGILAELSVDEGQEIEILEWFNSKVVGGRIEVYVT